MRKRVAVVYVTTALVCSFASNLWAHHGPFDGKTFRGRIAYSADNQRSASHGLCVRLAGSAAGRIRTSFDEPYAASAGRYDVEVRYSAGKGGGCRFSLHVQRQQQGAAWDAAAEEQGWKTQTIRDVSIRSGDEITVEIGGESPVGAKLAYVQLCGAAEPGEKPRPAKSSMIFPGKDWSKAAPQSQGVDPTKLQAAIDYLGRSLSEHGGAGSVFIVRNGHAIWAGPECDRQYQIYSATKSFTSTILGLLIEDGKVSLDTLAKDLEPGLAKQYSTVTLRHFATMTSGYDSAGGSYEFDRQGRGDSWNPGPPAPPIFPPGTRFRYWDDAMSQFGSLLTKAAGGPLDRLFKSRIADPIGMTRWRWTENNTPAGRVLSWTGGIHTSSRELARFGHLFLNGGNWNGKQLVSASWVAQATTVQVPATIPNDELPRSRGSGIYGYNWWVNGVKPNAERLWPGAPPRTFYANGLHSNVCIVVPEWSMVIARTNGPRKGGSANSPSNIDEIWSGFFSRLAEAVNP